MPEYTLEEYGRRQRFIDAVNSRDIDVNNLKSNDYDVLNRKRELLGMLYKRLKVEGGQLLPLEECDSSRVCAALKNEYCLSVRFVAEFSTVRQLIVQTNEKLSLEDRAQREAAKMPLFATTALDTVRACVQNYFAGLTPEQRKVVKIHFGQRVKQYLTNSGRLKVQV